MTTPARLRYLEALELVPASQPERPQPRDPADAPTPVVDEVSSGREPTKETTTQREISLTKREKSSSSTHFTWLTSDGEWEALLGASHTSSPEGPQTLAGTVADTKTNTDLDEVWARYKARGKQADRDHLIVHYAPLVKYVASRIASGLPQNVDQADLVSYGMFGLIDAITKFDPDRGFKFETYAISRIKGAVLDELRSIDWVPRSVRAKAKSVERAMSKLESELHRAPTDDEIADELDLTVPQLNAIYNQISSLGMVALDEMLSFGAGDSMTLGDTLADRRDGPGGQFERVEMRQLLGQAINRMGEREKIVLTLYYYEALTLAEIGGVLGVTESRVCQIHTKAVLQLRGRLQAAEREAV